MKRDDRGSLASAIQIGRVAGFPLALDWSVLIIVWLLAWGLATGSLPDSAPGHASVTYWVAGFAGALLLVGSLLAHELAHALAARRSGIEVKSLTLWLFGGVASLGGEATTPAAELRIAAVGPATSVAIGAAFAVAAGLLDVLGGDSLLVGVAGWLAGINVLLAIFNLIPGAPLDGGRVLRALLWRHHGDRVRAAVSAARAGRVVAFGLIWLGLLQFVAGTSVGGLWLVFIGWFLLNAARAEEADVVARHALAGVRVSDVMSHDPQVAPGWLTIDGFIHEYLLGNRHSSYPVEDGDGDIQGLVTLTQLRAVPPGARGVARVADVAVPLASVPTAAPDEDLVGVLGRLSPQTGGRALVFQQGELVGIITPADVARAVEIGTLRSAQSTSTYAS